MTQGFGWQEAVTAAIVGGAAVYLVWKLGFAGWVRRRRPDVTAEALLRNVRKG